jgi:hypothetical protein
MSSGMFVSEKASPSQPKSKKEITKITIGLRITISLLHLNDIRNNINSAPSVFIKHSLCILISVV